MPADATDLRLQTADEIIDAAGAADAATVITRLDDSTSRDPLAPFRRPGPEADSNPKAGSKPCRARESGCRIGPYRLIEKLGEGGMGEVWKASHVELDKAVALKLLPTELVARPDAAARFKREMRAAGRVTHPNVVAAFDAGEADAALYIATEYVAGTDLYRRVLKSGPLSVTNACRAIRQAALGLAAAHSAGLVHRDVKPHNLLLGRDGRVKLSDLGLARLTEEAADAARPELTACGQVMGTPDYMAPEQWDDARGAGPASDVYALGCTLYFLLAGHAPFGTDRHRTAVRKMVAHVSEPPPDVREFRPDVPPHLSKLIQRLMAKSPDERPGSPEEVAGLLLPYGLRRPDTPEARKTPLLALADNSSLPEFQLLSGVSEADHYRPLPAVRRKGSKLSRSLPYLAAAVTALLAFVLFEVWA